MDFHDKGLFHLLMLISICNPPEYSRLRFEISTRATSRSASTRLRTNPFGGIFESIVFLTISRMCVGSRFEHSCGSGSS
uniref:Uncharacterized protein n=1 Tax=Lutzomyia longipalpis TaxID=7200 RepID=A0A1B0GGV8_LUTLO